MGDQPVVALNVGGSSVKSALVRVRPAISPKQIDYSLVYRYNQIANERLIQGEITQVHINMTIAVTFRD
jgi:hypothetical protein